MSRKIRDAVIVVTGASSGIGRATARAFAQKGGTVVLAARREDALQGLAAACESLGGRALAVPTDVRDETAVKALARQAVAHFGRIDVWVNNAAVTLFGRLEETPSDVYKEVFETNVFGYVHGMRAVLPYFREQGSGVIINVSSVVSTTPQPYTSAYSASKAAIRSLSDSLRMELSLDGSHDIHVCTVMPATIDTPIFQHAANYTGRATKAMNPVYPAEKVAEAIVALAERPKRETYVGRAGRFLAFQRTFMPALFERTFARQVDTDHLQDRPAPPTQGNVFEPKPGFTGISGGWYHNGRSGSGKKLALGVLALAGTAALVLGGRRS